ncbi:MAG: hypothetical protein O2954_06605, partial [bacterium]|nr:hypothetical protein [bacterium]
HIRTLIRNNMREPHENQEMEYTRPSPAEISHDNAERKFGKAQFKPPGTCGPERKNGFSP